MMFLFALFAVSLITALFALIGSVAIILLAQKLLHKNIPILLIWLVTSVLITLRYKLAVFHNLICPFGLLQKVCPSDALAVKSVNKKADINGTLLKTHFNSKINVKNLNNDTLELIVVKTPSPKV